MRKKVLSRELIAEYAEQQSAISTDVILGAFKLQDEGNSLDAGRFVRHYISLARRDLDQVELFLKHFIRG